MKYKIALLIWLILILFSCSTSQFGWKSEQGGEGDASKEEKYNEDFDPLSLEEEEIVVRPSEQIPEEEMEQDDGSAPDLSEDLALNEREMVQGFRIQLLATTDELQARDAKKRAIFKFQTGVYLVFEAPHYKLRIGDCMNKKEAEDLKMKAFENGFRDAWIVPSKVYQIKNEASNL